MTVNKTWNGKSFLYPIIIAFLGLAVYAWTLEAPFQFDDRTYLFDNPLVKDLKYYISPSEAGTFSDSSQGFFYHFFKTRFIGYLTFALDYRMHGLSVTGYHVFNLFVHITNALLLYCQVHLMVRTPRLQGFAARAGYFNHEMPLFAALLFVAHPVQTEAVIYISQRFSSLATTFYLLSITFYGKARLYEEAVGFEGRRLRMAAFFVLSVSSAIAAMLTKEISFTLPISAALYEVMFFDGRPMRRFIRLLPLLATFLIIPFNVIGPGIDAGHIFETLDSASRSHSDLPRMVYFTTELRVIMTYIRLLLWPVNQNLDYDYPVYPSALDPEVILSLTGLVGLVAAALLLFRFSRKNTASSGHFLICSFGIFWFFITISVESSFIPIEDVIFEHRLYLPSVGAFISASAMITYFIASQKKVRRKVAVLALLSFIVMTLIAAAIARNRLWLESISLWEDVVKKSPGKIRGINDLGVCYLEGGMNEKALGAFQRIVTLRPGYAKGYNNIGMAYWKAGKTDLALVNFNLSATLDPNDAVTHRNMGLAYRTKGLEEKAAEHFRRAYELDRNRDGIQYMHKGSER